MWPFKRRGLRWERLDSRWIVRANRGRLGLGATIDDQGATCRPFLRSRRYGWDEIAAVSVDAGRNGWWLCLCIYGDPYPKPMDAASKYRDEVLALFEPIGEFVEERGAEVIKTDDPATYWWHADLRAGRGHRSQGTKAER